MAVSSGWCWLAGHLSIAAAAVLALAGAEPAAAQGGWSTEVAVPAPAPDQRGATPGGGRRAAPAAASPGGAVAKAAKPGRIRATGTRIEGDAQRTRLSVELTAPVEANVYALAEPYRVVVDIPDVEFVLPAGSGRRPHGLIGGFRFGLFEAGRARIVVDAAGPVAVERVRFAASASGPGGQLVVDLARVAPERFAVLQQQQAAAGLRQGRFDDAGAGAPPAVKSRPVVVIDPGHGGPDPGTVSGASLAEKTIVLAVGRQLQSLLSARKQVDVHLTRDRDVFVALDERVRFSRRVGADLFVSLHIDAVAEAGLAQSVRGASIYILAERASDEAARRLADKENASDILAGIENVPSSEEDHVRSILSDLTWRETATYSAEFRSLLSARLQNRITLAREPQRAAAFKVLKQTEVPSVLVELGYMSHAEDRALIAKPEWQRQVAAAIAEGIEAYFALRQAAAQP